MKNIFSSSVVFLLTTLGIWAQSPISSSVDSTDIKIGSPLQLIIKAQVNVTDQVIFPNTPTLGPFEVLDHMPIDNRWACDLRPQKVPRLAYWEKSPDRSRLLVL